MPQLIFFSVSFTVNSKVSSGKVTPVLPNQIPSMTIITGTGCSSSSSSSSNNVLQSKKAVTTVTCSNTGTKVSTTLVKPKPSSTFASVASGESFGMIQTGGTHPGSLVKVQKTKSPDNNMLISSSAMDEPFGTFTVESSKVNVVEQQQQQSVATAKANLDNKDYSPFKSFGGWQDDKNNFGSAVGQSSASNTGVGMSSNENDLAAKAPGYRISPSGGPLFPSAASGWANVSVAATSLSVANPMTSASNMSGGGVSSIMTSSGLYSMERSNSAPGSPILPPIGPPNPGANMVTKMQAVNNTSPGSEPDYRTGSSLSSGIGLSPGSSNNPMGSGGGPGGGVALPGSGRSLTPDNDMSSMSKSMAAMQDKNDLFVGSTSGVHRPASSGSANAGAFMVNPENLLSAAAQMASVGMFNASDLDYLAAAPPSRPVDFHRYNVQPPTSKLNPNAPDFMRPPMTATSSSVASSNIRSPMLNKNNNSFSNTRFNNRYACAF